MVDVAASAAMDVVQRTGFRIWEMRLEDEESVSEEESDEDECEDVLEYDDE